MIRPKESPGTRQRSEAGYHNIPENNRTAAKPAQQLLPRLEGVITTGKGWRAMCPACGGKSRKLSIVEGDNGTLLVKCFSCHDTPAVLAAVGLQMGDLFQRRDLRTMTPGERSQLRQSALLPRWLAALCVLSREATVLMIAARKLGDGDALDDAELTRMRIAALNVFDAKEVLDAR